MSLFLDLGWTGGANRDAANEAIREGREVQLGPLERLWGGTKKDAENIVKSETQKQLQRTYGAKLAELGLMVDWGDTESTILSKIGTRIQQRADGQTRKKDAQEYRNTQIAIADKEKDRELTRTTEQNKLTAQNNQLSAELQSQTNQFAHTSRENHANRQFERSENALNRRHERELGDSKDNLQMQIALMQSDLADKRMAYDRETQRMDRRDRMIAQLMQGIGQLGGAFSL